MSPPEVWGPAVWTLFHTLIEKMNPYAYPHVIGSMFGMMFRICKFLPCPECSADASNFLAKIKLNDYKTKDEFKNMLYLFHNYVNAKKRKPLYNYSNLGIYSSFNLVLVINNFISKYNTKGNMKLIAESFQRGFVIKHFISWFNGVKLAFIQPAILNAPQPAQEQPVAEISVENVLPTIEEVSSEESSVEEAVVEESVVEESDVKEEMYNNETISDEPIINSQISIEEPIKDIEIVKEPVKSKKNRKSKSKK
jgi:hypothetical protein